MAVACNQFIFYRALFFIHPDVEFVISITSLLPEHSRTTSDVICGVLPTGSSSGAAADRSAPVTATFLAEGHAQNRARRSALGCLRGKTAVVPLFVFVSLRICRRWRRREAWRGGHGVWPSSGRLPGGLACAPPRRFAATSAEGTCRAPGMLTHRRWDRLGWWCRHLPALSGRHEACRAGASRREPPNLHRPPSTPHRSTANGPRPGPRLPPSCGRK